MIFASQNIERRNLTHKNCQAGWSNGGRRGNAFGKKAPHQDSLWAAIRGTGAYLFFRMVRDALGMRDA